MKRITAILLALVLCLAVAACGSDTTTDDGVTPSGDTTNGGPTPSGATAPGGENVLAPGDVISAPEGEDVQYADMIDIIMEISVSVLDPHTQGSTGAATGNIYVCVYDKLIVSAGEGVYTPELATSWDSDDMQTWTFRLRNDVFFHNGDKFTAQDVVNTIESAKDGPGSYGFNSWRDVNTATAIDEYTVQIVLNSANADFLFLISMPGAGIISKAARDADPVTGAWIGTGAFYVSDFSSGDYVTLTRNDNYWGTPPITRVLNFHYVPEMTARTIMMQNGDSQMCTSISNEDMDLFVSDPDNYTIYAFIGNTIFGVYFNLNDPITGDLNFRKAVAYALNRPDITIVAAGEWAEAATDGNYWGNSTEFRNNNIPMLPYDLDLAKQCLAESSYNGEEVELMSALVINNAMAEVIQEQLSLIGINVKLFQTDAPTLLSSSVYGNDRVQMVSWVAAFTQSAAAARSMYYPAGGDNRASYNNPEVNDLLDLAPTIASPEERGAIYRQIQEIVAADLPFIRVFSRMFSLVCAKGVGGIIVSPDQAHDFRGIFLILDD